MKLTWEVPVVAAIMTSELCLDTKSPLCLDPFADNSLGFHRLLDK